jgi:Uncharacterized protein conserved in bacteria (DUF2252)
MSNRTGERLSKSLPNRRIAGYLGKTDETDEALTKFAFAYCKQNEIDYAGLQKAARSKRIKVAQVA